MIRSRNCDPNTGHEFAQKVVYIPISVGASAVDVIQGGWRAPWAGAVVSAHVYAATITDADDSARVDLKKNGTSMLAATVDPVAANTSTTLAPTTTSFASGDLLAVHMTTGAGDAMVGGVNLVVRPSLGTEV
jgi:hypothetical protein